MTNIVAGNASIGINQQWRDVTSQRQGGVTYTNKTGRPIAVFVRTKTKLAEEPAALGIGGSVDGIQVAFNGSDYGGLKISLSVNFIVPAGANYVVNALLGHADNFVSSWVELR
ncbi:tail fiber protein [Xenorhabdus cabanillasii JM26]|nr:tail fiber protein [Xenorhabdus cabanillasii JM26]